MRALYLLLPILCILAIAYRYYSAFVAARIMSLDDSRTTPAHIRNDGHNYHPTHRLVLFGHHFAAITGAGPLIGPVLAAQFGYAPGLIWNARLRKSRGWRSALSRAPRRLSRFSSSS
jgi:carbon starvation protein